MTGWQPRLIASDLDGTLLRDEGTVSAATAAELARWQAAGVPVVLATGRGPVMMRGIRQALPMALAVCCNGAVLLDLRRFEILHQRVIDRTTVRDLIGQFRSRVLDVWLAAEYDLSVSVDPVDDLTSPPATAKLTVASHSLDPGALLALVREIVDQRGTVTTSSASATAEITAPGVTKASGLAIAAAALGIAPADVLVFGDMPNDLAAFEWVREAGGQAVAMAHAHPDVLAAATDVTTTNEDDGVARFLAALRRPVVTSGGR